MLEAELAGIRWVRATMLALVASIILSITGAIAHPHIWIDARIAFTFNDFGELTAVTHEWTFDQAFSQWTLQGLDTNNDGRYDSDELQVLADDNIVGLAEYDYFTFAGIGNTDLDFAPTGQPRMHYDGARITLTFNIAPPSPLAVAGEKVEFEVTDPEYYSAFTFLTSRGATLNNAPEACRTEVNRPKAIDPALEQRLFEIGPDVTALPPDLKAAASDLANVVFLDCTGAPPATAVEAAQRMASEQQERRASPFSAPPAEKGLPVVRTGFLGWINAQQQAFYGALNDALSELRNGYTALITLGVLSFLYGVFHAAGPGHGKVVISSYVLATESEVKRGIVLSVASALLQSLVAVIFVLIAGLLLGLTATQFANSTDVIVMGSYVLVIALGLWLIVRKLFNLGHHHHVHDHSHDHDGHAHFVDPKRTGSTVREMAGVVFAVGLRPCSGALVVLVFALSQGVFAAGVASVFLMGLGTALTVAVLATLAILLKDATRLLRGRYAGIAKDLVWWLELAGAVLVLLFGIVLLAANL